MEDLLSTLMIDVWGRILKLATEPIRAGTLSMMSFIFGKGSESLAGIFQNPILQAFTSIADIFCWVCFVFALLFYFLKIAQEERKNWQVILMCPVKAIIFIITYQYIVQVCYLLPCYLIGGLQRVPQLSDLVNEGSFDDIFTGLSTLQFGWITPIVFTIAVIAFACIAIMRIGGMMIQILNAPLYVPYVLMGDSQKMMEWVISTVSVGFTFVIQYSVFYSGLVLLIYGGGEFLNYFVSLGLIFATFLVPRQMQKFGWSSGSGHAFQATAQTTVSGGNMLISSMRMIGR